jgi:hypothetical protein
VIGAVIVASVAAAAASGALGVHLAELDEHQGAAAAVELADCGRACRRRGCGCPELSHEHYHAGD